MTTTVHAEATLREAGNAQLMAALAADDAPEVTSSFDLDVVNDTERGRWIALLGAEPIGELSYRFVGGRVVLLSTWVDHAYRDRGVATELIARALDEVRASGARITVICPVVGVFIAHHPAYRDLIDDVHPGSGAFPPGPQVGGAPDRQVAVFEHDVS